MFFSILGVVFWLCAIATWAPLRTHATCAPTAGRVRRGFGLTCGSFAALGFGRFGYYVLWLGHPLFQWSVIIGQTASLTLAVQAILLWRDSFPPRRWAIALGSLSAVLGTMALLKGAMEIF